jgi:hypothetical protein
MDWIKQNIVLVASLVVSLAMIGGSGYYFYSMIGAEGGLNAELATAQSTYADFLGKTPFPSPENFELIKQQQTNLLALRARTEKQFPVLVTSDKIRSSDFADKLAGVVDELKMAAQTANVTLPTNNTLFAFTAQRAMLQFDSNALPVMMVQLGDIKTLCNILFESKVYEINGIKRAALPSDAAAKEAYPTDYLPSSRNVVTNALTGAIVLPYELTFKGVSVELATVMEKMAKSPAGILVKAVTVAPIEEGEGGEGSAYTPTASQALVNVGAGRRMSRQMADRYGLLRRGARPPTAAGVTPTDAASEQAKKPSLLKEKPFRATLYLEMVKLQPLSNEKAAATKKNLPSGGASSETSTNSN